MISVMMNLQKNTATFPTVTSRMMKSEDRSAENHPRCATPPPGRRGNLPRKPHQAREQRKNRQDTRHGIRHVGSCVPIVSRSADVVVGFRRLSFIFTPAR